jgi:hypothetical protein
MTGNDTGGTPGMKEPGIVHHAIPGCFKKRGKKMKKMITHYTHSINHRVLRKKARFL